MWRRCVIAPRYIPPRPPPRAGIVRRTPRHSPCAHAVAGDDHAASCRRNAVRLPFRRRACGLRLVRNRARRAGVGRHRDPARRADPGHARGGRPGASLGHGLSARWRHPHHRTPRQSAAAAHSRRPVRALERRTQGGRAGQGGLLDVALSPDFAKDRLVYLSYAEAGDGRAGTAVGRGRLADDGPAWRISASCSGRSPSCPRGCISVPAWCWTAKGIFTSRWARTTSAPPRKTWASCRARWCASADGSVPPDNPFVGKAGARPRSGPMATAIRRAWR